MHIDAAPADVDLRPHVHAIEQERHDDYRDELAARMFLTGATLLRCLAGRALGLSPRHVAVDRTCRHCGAPHGRPRVLDASGTEGPLCFSVSHSHGHVAVAVARQRIGLDVQATDPRVDLRRLRHAFLSEEELRDLEKQALIEDDTVLLHCWARKEAVLKMHGTGFASDPIGWTIRTDGHAPGSAEVLHLDGTRRVVGLRSWSPGPRLACSVASQWPADVREHDGAAVLAQAGAAV